MLEVSSKSCEPVLVAAPLCRRVVRSVQIRLLADIFGVEHSLYTRLEISRTGKAIERQDLPAWSLQWKETEKMYEIGDEAGCAASCAPAARP